MIVLKEDAMKEVWHEARGLMRIDPDNHLEVMWGNHKQVYTWANDIEYTYDNNGRKKEILHVVICQETWIENHSRSTGKIEDKSSRYAWISSRRLCEKNVFSRCTEMGRYRWKIENNILTEKHQGYEYEHCYSYTWNAMEGYHYLMKIGRFLNVLAHNSELLSNEVTKRGIQGFIKYFRLYCNGCPLNKEKIETAVSTKRQWRIKPAAA